jgi:hypothetical protein
MPEEIIRIEPKDAIETVQVATDYRRYIQLRGASPKKVKTIEIPRELYDGNIASVLQHALSSPSANDDERAVTDAVQSAMSNRTNMSYIVMVRENGDPNHPVALTPAQTGTARITDYIKESRNGNSIEQIFEVRVTDDSQGGLRERLIARI